MRIGVKLCIDMVFTGYNNNSIQFNSIYLCAKLNSPEANNNNNNNSNNNTNKNKSKAIPVRGR
jgi:hypothetical protein